MRNIQCLFFLWMLFSCTPEKEKEMVSIAKKVDQVVDTLHTEYSTKPNQYINFNSPNAINKVADMENEYFKSIDNSVSKYYGTVWKEKAENTILESNISQFEDYLLSLKLKNGDNKPDSLHCTIYAYEALKAGFNTEQFNKLEDIYKRIWKSREVAGWSIGYILVKHFNWQAYLILNKHSSEYDHCMNAFTKNQTYPVWKQPNIPLE